MEETEQVMDMGISEVELKPEQEIAEQVIKATHEALLELANGLRKRSNYKRYSNGMRRAFANRASGVEKSAKLVLGLIKPL